MQTTAHQLPDKRSEQSTPASILEGRSKRSPADADIFLVTLTARASGPGGGGGVGCYVGRVAGYGARGGGHSKRAWMDEDLELPAWPTGVPAPKLVCFDLDDTIWFPEMYMISGAPFEQDDELRVYDRSGEEIKVRVCV